MDKKIIEHFKKVDSVLFLAFDQAGVVELKKSDDYFKNLCREIINQQLSDKAGDTIFARFESLFPRGQVTPKEVLKVSTQKMRSAGPSYSKIGYIKGLARAVVKGDLRLDKLDSLDDQAIIEELIKVKGIGQWTAEMFLIFSLNREDIFSHGDLGLKKAIKNLYNLKDNPTREQTEEITAKWSPFRTYGCMILWRSLTSR